jgi:hypothetical protein
VGLVFYPRNANLPTDHCIHKYLEELPDRFAKQKLLKEWVIEGPYYDEGDSEYYFFLIGKSFNTREKFPISESDMLFKPSAVNNVISRLVSRCSEIELTSGVAQRLMGKKEEEIEAKEGDDICIVEDFTRGKGRVFRRPNSLEEGEALPAEKKGGLILPSR